MWVPVWGVQMCSCVKKCVNVCVCEWSERTCEVVYVGVCAWEKMCVDIRGSALVCACTSDHMSELENAQGG